MFYLLQGNYRSSDITKSNDTSRTWSRMLDLCPHIELRLKHECLGKHKNSESTGVLYTLLYQKGSYSSKCNHSQLRRKNGYHLVRWLTSTFQKGNCPAWAALVIGHMVPVHWQRLRSIGDLSPIQIRYIEGHLLLYIYAIYISTLHRYLNNIISPTLFSILLLNLPCVLIFQR